MAQNRKVNEKRQHQLHDERRQQQRTKKVNETHKERREQRRKRENPFPFAHQTIDSNKIENYLPSTRNWNPFGWINKFMKKNKILSSETIGKHSRTDCPSNGIRINKLIKISSQQQRQRQQHRRIDERTQENQQKPNQSWKWIREN